MFDDEFDQLKAEIINNPNKIRELTDDQILELTEKGGLGVNADDQSFTLPDTSKSWINASIINWRDEYFKRFYSTALRLFTLRRAAEWAEDKAEAERNTITDFIKHVFDQETSEKWGDIVKDLLHKEVSEIKQDCISSGISGVTTETPIADVIKAVSAAPQDPWTTKTVTKLMSIDAQLSAAIDPTVDLAAPPNPFIYHLNRFVANNYEDIREKMGSYKVDVEYSIIYYESYKTAEDAAAGRRRWADNFMLDVYTIESNGITLLGPWRKNNDKIEFYDKETDAVNQMFKQAAEDAQTGKELMKRRIKETKEKNIEECGEDAGGLSKYIQAASTAHKLGMKRPSELTADESKELHIARNVKESAEVPKGSIAVDVYTTDGKSINKSKIYTETVAPQEVAK